MKSLSTFFLACTIHFSCPATADIFNGLVAHYPFEGDVTDQSGNLNDGLAFGGVGFIAGIDQGRQALSLDGVDDYLQLPRTVDNSFSVTFWVKTTAIAPAGSDWWQGYGIVDGEVCGSPPGGDWGIALLAGGHISFWNYVTASEVNDGEWHSVILTRDMAQDQVVVYIDGTAEIDNLALVALSLTGPPWIGVGNNPCDVSMARGYFPGQVDELRFYDRVLTAAEIRLLAHNGIFADGFED